MILSKRQKEWWEKINTFKKERKEADYFKPLKVKCKCGHVVTLPAYVDEIICTWCKKKIKNNTKAHFIYKLRIMKEIEESKGE